MNTSEKTKLDWITVFMYLTLALFGWLSVYSSSYSEINGNIFPLSSIAGKQLFFIIISIILGSLILLTDSKIIPKIGYLAYIFTVGCLILVLIFGKEVGGAKAWFKFGSFGLQPSEFAKVGTILAIAKFINKQNLYFDKFSVLVKVGVIIFIPTTLILLQPDAGSALIYMSLIIMFFREGLPLRYIISIILIIILSLITIIVGVNASLILLITLTIILGYLLKKNKQRLILALLFFIGYSTIITTVNYSYENILGAHQKERIDVIIGKEKNKLGSGYNLNQSLIAIGSGGFFGKGYLKGTQTKGNFVPEQNTDFIFCTIGEEFGFMGSLIVIILFMLFVIRLIILSEKQTSRFSRVIGYSVVSILLGHIFINIGMTIGLIPVIGIPLPFFSYGGSSMLAFTMLIFIFLRLDLSRLERF